MKIAQLQKAVAKFFPPKDTLWLFFNLERSRSGDDDVHFHGGRPAKRGEFPFLVLLLVDMDYQNWEQRQCSGSILSPTAVLTAAHCDVGDITVVAGVEDRMEAEVENKYVQKRYVESIAKPVYPIIYDVMICFIREEWEWNEFVAPVALHLNVSRLQPSFVISCKVLGFGVTKKDRVPQVAHVMDQLVGTSSQCLNIHPFIWFWSFWMCSINIKNKTMCMADSGGPVVCLTAGGYHQYAVNMGMGPEQEMDCVPTKTANIYVATAPLRNWIVDSVKDLAYIPSSADTIQRSSLKISLYEERSRFGDDDVHFHGGRPAKRGEFPFLVLLLVDMDYQNWEQRQCSGSILSPTAVLTAAHCDVGDITVIAGLEDRMEAEVENKYVQMRYVESVAKPVYPIIYDIMICYINREWDWSEFVAPVALHLNVSRLQPSFVISCKVLGFGVTKKERVPLVAHVMDQLVGTSSQCLNIHPFIWFWSFWMCSINIRNKTMCMADSGGPVVCSTAGGCHQWAVNMGMGPEQEMDCVPMKTANIYIATAPLRNWIVDNVKDLAYIPSSADSIRRSTVKISLYEVLQYLPLWLFLSSTAELLYLH